LLRSATKANPSLIILASERRSAAISLSLRQENITSYMP